MSVASARDAPASGDKYQYVISRFVEDIPPTVAAAAAPRSPRNMSTSTITTASTSHSSPARAPASIPIRTSSTKAVPNGDFKFPAASDRSPRKQRSLHSIPGKQQRLPEVDERDWLSQSSRSSSSKMPQATSRSDSAQLPVQSHTLPAYAGAEEKTRESLGSEHINGNAFQWTSEKENILRGPYDYLESFPGKDVRSQLISAFDAWLQVPAPSLRVITRVVAMLHTSSLLIDDVEDNSLLRRGNPVAHSIFGTAQTINSANYIYFCALQELSTLNNPEVVRIYTEELLNLHRGQGMDLFWRDTLTCPTEDDYLEMVGNKTGGLFRLAIKLMCAESPSHNAPVASNGNGNHKSVPTTDYIPLVNTIGLLFQILDDYRNLSDTTYTQNKGLCEDLTEGKFSFPIIHAIRADPANLVLINILKQKTQDEDVKRYAVSHMESMGSFAYTRRVLRGLTKKALSLIDEVDRTTGLEARGEGVKSILERLRVDKQRDRASMPEISEGRER